MPPAIGTFPPRNTHGPNWRDIRDFGAIAGIGPSAAAATGAAVQAAIDSLASSGGGTVYIPAGSWALGQPIYLDAQNVGLVGEPLGQPAGYDGPPGSQITLNSGMPGFIVGIPRKPAGSVVSSQSLTSGHFIDLYGKLDASAASAAGQRWGIRTNGDAFVSHGTGHFVHTSGSYWSDVRQVTSDFAIDLTLTPNYYTTIFASSNKGRNYPMTVVGRPTLPGYLQVIFATVPMGSPTFTTTAVQRNFLIPVPSSGVCRVSFQIDLINATIAAWVNGVQVTLGGPPPAADFVPGSNLAFPENMQVPFKLGAHGGQGNDPRGDFYSTGTAYDIAIYGLRIARGLRYASDGAGYYQRRIGQGSASTSGPTDAGLNDLYRYFTVDSSTIGLFPFQNSPSQVIANRVLNVRGYNTQDSLALFLQTNHQNNYSSIGGNFFRNLSIQHNTGYSGFSGAGILSGYTLDLTVTGCTIAAGSQGIGSWNWGANYITHVLDCTLAGADAAYYNYYGISRLQRLNFLTHGRATLWFNSGQHIVRDVFGLGNAATVFAPALTTVVPEYVVVGQNGADVDYENFGLDMENASSPWPSRCYVYMETGVDNSYGGRLRAKGFGFSLGPFDIPQFLLHTTSPSDPPATAAIDLHSVAISNNFSAVVQTDGPAWRGEVRMGSDDAVSPRVKSADGSNGGFIAVEDQIVLPRFTAWNRGGHVLKTPSPADGQVAEWQCSSSGRYGTSTPPVWTPTKVVDAAIGPAGTPSSSLAAYLFDHGWLSAGAGTREGYFADYAQAALLSQLLTGTPATQQTGLYAALGPWPAGRSTYRELRGNGYARVPILANAVQTVTVVGTPTAGTFTLSLGGQTTAPLAFNASAAAVQSALQALSSIGAGNAAVAGSNGGPYTVTFQGAMGYKPIAAMTSNGAGLTGGTSPSVAVAVVATGTAPIFAASAGGSTWSIQPIAFPSATADWGPVRSLLLLDGSSNLVAAINFDPINVAAGMALSFASGTLTVAGSASGFYRALSDSWRDQFNNFWLRGGPSPSTPTVYLVLSTSSADVAKAPAEPTGNGYARLPLSSSMTTPAPSSRRTWSNAVSSNATPLAFPTPTGPWGTVRSVYLMDAASAGNVVAAANLTVPRSPDAGGAAPTFAPGALWVTRN